MKAHTKDSDCTCLDGQCIECGVSHGDPCPTCGGTGFHRWNCKESDTASDADFVLLVARELVRFAKTRSERDKMHDAIEIVEGLVLAQAEDAVDEQRIPWMNTVQRKVTLRSEIARLMAVLES